MFTIPVLLLTSHRERLVEFYSKLSASKSENRNDKIIPFLITIVLGRSLECCRNAGAPVSQQGNESVGVEVEAEAEVV